MEKERVIEQTTSGGTGISSGFLRTKISLKGNQSQLSLVSPFYGMKPELPPQSQLLGSEDLISLFDLSGPYNRYHGAKKPKEDLASFLPHVCGSVQINRKADASCSLRQLIEKPPIMGKEISNLTASQMVGFKLAPGPVADSNKYFDLTDLPTELAGTSISNAEQERPQQDESASKHGKRMKRSLEEMDDGERKVKKHRGEEKEKEKKKKKKDKKKKKEKEREKKALDEEQKKIQVKRETIAPFF